MTRVGSQRHSKQKMNLYSEQFIGRLQNDDALKVLAVSDRHGERACMFRDCVRLSGWRDTILVCCLVHFLYQTGTHLPHPDRH